MSARTQVPLGFPARASCSISAELSRPVIEACGQRSARTAVLLPVPQPRSITLRTFSTDTWAARSRLGRVRSSANLRYWFAFQVVLPFMGLCIDPWYCLPGLESKRRRRRRASAPDLRASFHQAIPPVRWNPEDYPLLHKTD